MIVVNKHSRKEGKRGNEGDQDQDVGENIDLRAQKRANRKGAFVVSNGAKPDLGLGDDKGKLALLSPNILDGVEMTKPGHFVPTNDGDDTKKIGSRKPSSLALPNLSHLPPMSANTQAGKPKGYGGPNDLTGGNSSINDNTPPSDTIQSV